MSISKATFKKLESLAALEVDEEECQTLCQHMDLMLHWLIQLPPVTSSSAPGAPPAEIEALDSSVSPSASNDALRDDLVQDSLLRSAVLRNAPDELGDCYRVPTLHERDP